MHARVAVPLQKRNALDPHNWAVLKTAISPDALWSFVFKLALPGRVLAVQLNSVANSVLSKQ